MQSDYIFLISLNQIAVFLKLLNLGVSEASVAMLYNAEWDIAYGLLYFAKLVAFA